MTKTIPAVEARIHFGQIMQRAFKKGDRFIIEKSGIPMVTIINAGEYKKVIEERDERFKVLERIKAKLPNIPEEEIEKDAAKAVQALRKQHA